MLLLNPQWIADEQRVGPPSRENRADYVKWALDPENDVLAEKSENLDRTILALLMLLGQTITVSTRHDLRPSNPKRAQKMRVPGQVTIITLRHASSLERKEGESHVEWQHRWLVRGHWRSQSCGSDYPLAQEISPGVYRARIYITPFIKGPEDRPFHAARKINALIR